MNGWSATKSTFTSLIGPRLSHSPNKQAEAAAASVPCSSTSMHDLWKKLDILRRSPPFSTISFRPPGKKGRTNPCP
ncbi:serpin-z4 [Phtheirospermum japonicum]|uniref:Serpin-z4 n=1 Tax=Phtheirospermum japonicum TaxID=374723 RepID=A0A830B353_9LAMI|nr:serpin-z4 [Phtheirospermum japonicum]